MKPLKVYLETPNQDGVISKDIFVVVKPGFEEKAPAIIDLFAKQGFRFKQMRTKYLTMNEAKRMYYMHKGEDFYYSLCKYMSSGPCIGIIFEYTGEGKVFKIVDELKDKIRKKFGEDDMRNCLHSSDSPENMEKESSIFF